MYTQTCTIVLATTLVLQPQDMSTTKVLTKEAVVGSIAARGSHIPLQRNGALDQYSNFEVTPTIGTEFSKDVQLSELVRSNNEEALKDLAVLGEL